MNKQLLIAVKASVRRLWTMAALVGAVTLAPACADENLNAERSETIRVYAELGGEPAELFYTDVRGSVGSIFIESNVDYQLAWQDSESSPWAKIVNREPSGTPGIDKVTLEFKPRQTYSYYTRRVGTLLISSPQNKLGKFVNIYQGAVARVSQGFTWLNYGSADPLTPGEEKAIGGWTSVQKEYGWSSQSPAYCFGKNGYVKLGDDKANRGDIVTPYVNELRADSMLMVSFRAVAYTDSEGNTDEKKLTVKILGGGVFHDTGLKTREIAIESYPVAEGMLTQSMWKKSNYLLFVIGEKLHPITADTQIQFISGGETMSPGANSRIFLDNVYLYALNEYNDELASEKLSGDKDTILGDDETTPEPSSTLGLKAVVATN